MAVITDRSFALGGHGLVGVLFREKAITIDFSDVKPHMRLAVRLYTYLSCCNLQGVPAGAPYYFLGS